jgi:hypothetical protein
MKKEKNQKKFQTNESFLLPVTAQSVKHEKKNEDAMLPPSHLS